MTGASGFIGHQVVRTLAETHPESTITGVGRIAVPESEISSPNYNYISCDLGDEGAYGKLPDSIDVVINTPQQYTIALLLFFSAFGTKGNSPACQIIRGKFYRNPITG